METVSWQDILGKRQERLTRSSVDVILWRRRGFRQLVQSFNICVTFHLKPYNLKKRFPCAVACLCVTEFLCDTFYVMNVKPVIHTLWHSAYSLQGVPKNPKSIEITYC